MPKTWTGLRCRTCGESLVAVVEPIVPSYTWHGRTLVHHDGFDQDTLEVKQRDAGHVPILVKERTLNP